MAPSPGELQLLRMTTDLRTQLMASLVDADLAFAMPGNPPLGDLCRPIGDTERAYIDSFRTGRMSWDVRNDEPGLDRSVERLRAWYAALDAELEAVLADVPDEQFREGHIERDGGFAMPTGAQFHAWREAILIFCAKADVYRRAMGKPRSEQWEHWIG
jgi:hypothetical protein